MSDLKLVMALVSTKLLFLDGALVNVWHGPLLPQQTLRDFYTELSVVYTNTGVIASDYLLAECSMQQAFSKNKLIVVRFI